jgi:hypothetical protein
LRASSPPHARADVSQARSGRAGTCQCHTSAELKRETEIRRSALQFKLLHRNTICCFDIFLREIHGAVNFSNRESAEVHHSGMLRSESCWRWQRKWALANCWKNCRSLTSSSTQSAQHNKALSLSTALDSPFQALSTCSRQQAIHSAKPS